MKKIWLIGAGSIAEEYAKVLLSLKKDFIVVGRGQKSAERFKENTGLEVIAGGLGLFLSNKPEASDFAIIATPLSELAANTKQLIEYGVRNIFCEKPGFQKPEELKSVYELSLNKGTKVFYAYNRRFFSSVINAQNIIEEDGGVKSFNFEFTEWGHVIEKLSKPKEDLQNWFYANSTHVVDLAFYLGGFPSEIYCVSSGELSWHKPAIFSGCGVSKEGALFNYGANWSAPGRWGVEILTSKHRLYLRPMEQLQIQNIGSVAINPVNIDDSIDKQFKPGFYLETKAFLAGDTACLCSIEEQIEHLRIYNKMLGIC